MIDRDAQALVKPAVACLQTDSAVGTGYLVRRDRIATCHHVVRGLAPGDPVACVFNSGEKRTAYMLVSDKPTDAALLELREPVSVEPLAIQDDIPEEFWIFGYPYFAKVAVSLEATLNDSDTIDQNGIRAFALVSSSFLGATTDSIGGLSGSPVLVGRCVVGHLSSVLGATGALQRPHLGLVFAVKAAGVRQLLGETPVVSAAIATPAAALVAVERHLATAKIQLEVQAAATATEISEVLAGQELDDATRLLAADRLLGLGQLGDALSLLDDAAPSDRRTELQAVAWSLQGFQAKAIAALHDVKSTAENAALLGGVYKRRWLQTRDDTWLRASHDAYQVGYEVDREAAYPVVNLSACKLWMGDTAGSSKIATDLADRLASATRSDWDEASFAEALLLAKRFDDARNQYAFAVQKKAGQARTIALMRRQVRRELPMLGLRGDAFDDLFPVPGVAVFTGHRVDPDEQRGRFPPSRVSEVKAQLARALGERKIGIGYVSAAAGSDVLFIELLLERGGDPRVFLPFPREAFLATVDVAWRRRVENVLDQVSTQVTVLAQSPPGNANEAYFECNEAMQDAALRMGQILDERVVLLGVVAAGSDSKRGNSVEMVNGWRVRGVGDEVLIDPSCAG